MDGVASKPVSRWVSHGALRIHYLDSGQTGDRAVVVVPGFGEEAADHLSLIAALSPRRVIAVDLRGRGRSSVVERGYSLDDHVADLDAAVGDAGIDRVDLVTYSRGTTYGLAWAAQNAHRVSSVTIGDYPALQIVPPPGAAEAVAARVWRGRPMGDRMPLAAMATLMAEAVSVDLWAEVGALGCPVLLIRGTRAGAMATAEVAAQYQRSVSDLRIVCFEESAHDLWSPDAERFGATVREFLENLDPGGS